MSNQLNRIVSAIEATTGMPASRSGQGFRTRCPHHGGKEKNLCISDGQKRVVMDCKSHGCDPKGVVESVGLTLSDLFYEQGFNNITPIVKHEPEKNPLAVKLLAETVGDMAYFDKYLVTDYLGNRGINVELPNDIGFLEKCYYSKGVYYPAMIGLIRDVSGNIISAHQTFIPSGYKLKNGIAKKILPSILPGITSGCAIRLSEHDSNEIFLTEGIETGFAVKQLMLAKEPVVWACISANGLAKVKLPEQYKTVNIFADKDISIAGEIAAKKAKERLESEGRTVRIVMPPGEIPEGKKSRDWHDILQEENCK